MGHLEGGDGRRGIPRLCMGGSVYDGVGGEVGVPDARVGGELTPAHHPPLFLDSSGLPGSLPKLVTSGKTRLHKSCRGGNDSGGGAAKESPEPAFAVFS